MKTLNDNWFTEGRIDFELKKYTLLSYLQDINLHFRKNKLYPPLSDLIYHYGKLIEFKENKSSFFKLFPEHLIDINLKELQFTYDKIIADDQLMQEIENIISYAIAEMNKPLQDGKEIYDFVEEQLTIEPVGVIPIHKDEGYLFICDGNFRDVKVYQYRITLIEDAKERLRGIHTSYIMSYANTFFNTLENIKIDLIKTRKTLPIPAVYRIETDLTFPIEETLLPVAKRTFVKYISAA
ncbi:hypothetical protein [Solitalea canadensis]|uniref:Uncharacterized protein n=1 Tax=Solitalea canadensis (strain ATCC 29591 / DSM 3403 / JCM 21819 / LMG 8368 / NBRC 15130 / NCIMB 12057 / USAM 9D) TaxID=929556 RepID=H8KXB6_SOLCM|nr:hypothetical protein [Solitalea canadensis]AFD08445.1 hypothetical protein Solca_3440 [Solitalea canadensis DSM 3403]